MSRRSDWQRLAEGVSLLSEAVVKNHVRFLPSETRRVAQHGLQTAEALVAAVCHKQSENKKTEVVKENVERILESESVGKIEEKSKEKIEEKATEKTGDTPNKTDFFSDNHQFDWKERHVPSSPLARLFGFGSLAAKLAVGTATQYGTQMGKGGLNKALINDSNAERLAETLCTMRGAALKLGQMLSISDENVLPPQLAAAMDRVRQGAHVMPKKQLHRQLKQELGDDWRDLFSTFDDVPIAAASIGQVHRAVLKNGDLVAMKIQYPGVAESIDSDLGNLNRLLKISNFLPKGLYIDEIMKVGRAELMLECDYHNEANNQIRFAELVKTSGLSNQFVVPKVYKDLSTTRILTSELVAGVAVDKIVNLSQEIRNEVAERILLLTIKELFDWRFMQTDPNWSNFMYNAATGKIALVDFGATRSFDEDFVDEYFKIVWSAANKDAASMMASSEKLGFLTGDESRSMMKAHEDAGMVVGEPFCSDEPFDFYESKLTTRLAKYSETFMKDRLTPPPQEVYSLHRKLAGAFLMCIKLKAVIPCRQILKDVAVVYADK